MSGNEAIGGWCGATNCNNSGFVRGVTIGTKTGGKWSFAESALNGLPNRYIGGVAIGPDGAYYVALNGFNRTFTEGPGAGIGHVFRSTDGNNWTDISANFPDIPTNSIKALADGSLVVGTDLGVLYRGPVQRTGSRLGTNLPVDGRDRRRAGSGPQHLCGDLRSRHLAHRAALAGVRAQ